MNVAVGPPLEDAGPEDAPTEELATSDDDPPTEDASDADEPIPADEEDPTAAEDDPAITEEELPATDVPALLPADVAPADEDDTAALEEPPWEEETPTLLARELDPGTLLEPAPDEELLPATDDAPMEDEVEEEPEELLESPPLLVHAPANPASTTAQMRFMRFLTPVNSNMDTQPGRDANANMGTAVPPGGAAHMYDLGTTRGGH